MTDATVALPQALLGYEVAEDGESQGLHGLGSCILIAIPEISLSFRLHDYSMGKTLATGFYSIMLKIFLFRDDPQCPSHWNLL